MKKSANEVIKSVYSDLVHALPDIIYEIDLKGNFIFISDSISRWGYDPAQLIGRHFSIIIDPDYLPHVSRDAVLSNLKGVNTGPENAPKLIDERRTGQRITKNLQVKLKFGEGVVTVPRSPEFEVFSIGLYVFGKNRRKVLIGTLGIMRDISEVKSGEKALVQVERYYRLLTESSNEIITILAHDGTILFKSESVKRIIGYTPIEMIGCNEYEFIHDDDRAILTKFLEMEWTHDAVLVFEYRIRHKELGWRVLESSIRQITDANEMTMCFIMNSRDVTDYINSRRLVQESGRKFRAVVENLAEVISLVGFNGEIEYISPVLEQMLGYSSFEAAGKSIYDYFSPDDRRTIEKCLAETPDGVQRVLEQPLKCKTKDGRFRIIELAVCDLLSDPYVSGIIFILRDITEKKEAEKALRNSETKYRALYENALVGMMTIDLSTGRVLATNELGFLLFGSGWKYDFIGEAIRDKLADDAAWEAILDELNEKGVVANKEVIFMKNDGTVFWAEITAKKYPDEDIIEAAVIDITKNKENEERIFRLKHFDGLTGLPNKGMFRTLLQKEISQSHKLALMCIGIDKLKSINDMYGISAGDSLLRTIAQKLQEVYFKKDVVARTGSDMFMVLLANIGISDMDINLDNMEKIARKAQSIFENPFEIERDSIEVSTNIGMCVYPEDGVDPDVLLRNCESALYIAKEKGARTFHYFDVQLNDKMMLRLKLERDLAGAIHNRNFLLCYQPKVDTAGRITGLEALVRWKTASGIICPVEFVPLAEKNGMIIDLGRIVIEMACKQSRQWQDMGYAVPKIAVNLSPFQFAHRELLYDLEAILKRTGVDPRSLEIEITESGIMKDEMDAIYKLRAIREMGIAISIDDFGTGYSSLSKLRIYPVDTLKIDKSFVDSLPGDSMSSIIATTIISLGHSLGFKVVAEGVETPEQLEFLTKNGCDQFQGFYFYRPSDPDSIKKIISRKSMCAPDSI